MIKDHKHVVVSALVNKTFDSPEHLADWLRRIIEGIGMTVADLPHNPQAFYCTDHDNTGYTGTAILVTSHCAVHMWDAVFPHKLEFDLYSCSDFSQDQILEYIKELDIVKCDVLYLDRSVTAELDYE